MANAEDCNDGDHLISPDAVETCDGTDNNFSGDELDATDIITWYADTDADTYGDPSDSTGFVINPVGMWAMTVTTQH